MDNQAHWPNFHASELWCRCGHCDSDGSEMDPVFMALLQRLRQVYGKPLVLSSAYRCPEHPEERYKAVPGEHTQGLAVDVRCSGQDALRILHMALNLGFVRIGINQKGPARFLHLGLAPQDGRLPSPTIWSY
jgi:hypothetical protein